MRDIERNWPAVCGGAVSGSLRFSLAECARWMRLLHQYSPKPAEMVKQRPSRGPK